MASKLVMTFADANGEDLIFSYNYADKDTNKTSARQLVNGIITNGSIFSRVPVSAKSAKIVSTTEKLFDLSE